MDVEGRFLVGCDYDIGVLQSPSQPMVTYVPLKPVVVMLRIPEKLKVIYLEDSFSCFWIDITSQILKMLHKAAVIPMIRRTKL